MIKSSLIRFCIVAILVSTGFQSCYKDKGNYDYHDINELTITGINSYYQLRQGDVLKISPTITGSLTAFNEDDYDYEWVRLRGTGSANLFTIATTKDLEYVVALNSGENRFFFRVKEKSDDPDDRKVVWSSDIFTVDVQNPSGPGFMMMCDIDGNAEVFYSSFYQNEFLDVMHVLPEGMPSLGKPLSVVCYPDQNSPTIGAATSTGKYCVALIGESGAYRLKVTDLTYLPEYELKKNILYTQPAGFGITGLYPASAKAYSMSLLRDNNGNYMLYSTSGSPTLLWVYGTYANVNSEFGTPFKASDKAVYVDGANGAILYNEDTRSFARLASKASYVSYFNADQEEIFDFNNTNRDLLYMHSRTQEGNDWSIVYAIMKDISDGRIYLVSFTLASNTDKAQRSQIEITSLPDIANAIEFEMTHGNVNNNFVFYRTDKQIYALDISSNTHSVVYTAPDNYFISLMKTVNASRCPENDILKGEMDDRMMVFTYNPSEPAETCGRMDLFEAGYAPGMGVGSEVFSTVKLNNKPVVLTGFGKVVSADWKQK